MKMTLTFLTLNLMICVFSQDTTITTSRENIPPQAVIGFEDIKTLFAGQEYTINVSVSGDNPIVISAKNAEVKLIEDSKKSTGGLRYSITPIKAGTVSVTIGYKREDGKTISLLMRMFSVIDFPPPSIEINRLKSGSVIKKLSDSTEIKCLYPMNTGIQDNFEVKSWEIKTGKKIFKGTEAFLSEEFIEYFNNVNDEYIHLTVFLKGNRTEHQKTEAIYLIKKE